MKPKVLILYVPGTTREAELSIAFQHAGAVTEILPLSPAQRSQPDWKDYQILALPGGFSYADALGAGKLWALELQTYFKEELQHFITDGKPVIGIGNGFQALVKSSILPGSTPTGQSPIVSLTVNHNGGFDSRWVYLQSQSQTCLWTVGLEGMIFCPIAHKEGNFQLTDPSQRTVLQQQDQIALCYHQPDGSPANGEYPHNPNGSLADIAGICNPQGNVLGLMPHPENHLFSFQNPYRVAHQSGLSLFKNGVQYAQQS